MGNCLNIKKQGIGGDDDDDDNVNLYTGNVLVITSSEGWAQMISEANKQSKIVLVNFSAAWCGPCRMIAPLYSELSERFPSLLFLTVDVDDLTEFSSSWDIHVTPTFFFLKNGQQIDKLIGANGSELEKKIALYANSVTVT